LVKSGCLESDGTLEVDRISASVSVSAPNVDKWALTGTFGVSRKQSYHIRFRRAAVGKFGSCRK